jgi:hypothetical protein
MLLVEEKYTWEHSVAMPRVLRSRGAREKGR